jgi:hypothetical protein
MPPILIVAPESDVFDTSICGGCLQASSLISMGLAAAAVAWLKPGNYSGMVFDFDQISRGAAAREAAAPFGLPVMVHIGQSFSPIRAILLLLKRGDIVTHMYAPPPNPTWPIGASRGY